MKKSGVGEKRPRDAGDRKKGVKFIPGLKLSQHPPQQRKDLFLKKLHNIVRSKSLHPTAFEGYTIKERFSKMGWEQLLNLNCDKIYRRVVIEWMASLTKNGDELMGIVDGKSYSITPAIICDVLGVDTRKDLPYGRFSEVPIVEYGSKWLEARNTVFGLHENGLMYTGYYARLKMTPLAKILWTVMFSALHDSVGDQYVVKQREIYLLQALFTGDVLYSFAHLMIDDIWNMYEDEKQHSIPHGSYISLILDRLGAVSKDESAEMVCPKYCVISRKSCDQIHISESPTEYIVDDLHTNQRVTFPKKVIDGEAPCQSLGERKECEKEKFADERERRAEERERRAEEREKRAEEREKRAEERERHAEIRAQEREKRVEDSEGSAEERERWAQEREKCAEERAKRAQETEKCAEERVERAQEREKCAEERVERAQEREKWALEKEKWALESEGQAKIRVRERVKFAEEREQWAEDRERQALIRVQEREKRVEERVKRAEEAEAQTQEDLEKLAHIRAQVREKQAVQELYFLSKS